MKPCAAEAAVIAPDEVVAVLLAAGQSRRFGSDDKLLTFLRGEPLVSHAARTLVQLAPTRLVAVCADERSGPAVLLRALGFEIVPNAMAESGLATSLACGIARAEAACAKAALVCLADMPFVSVHHLRRLLARFDPASAPVVASRQAEFVMPPALFACAHFQELRSTTGDRGAQRLIQGAKLVDAGPDELRDIDRPQDLA